MNSFVTWLNIFGLTFDMIGVLGLFFSISKGYGKIDSLKEFSSILMYDGGFKLINDINKYVNEIIVEINNTIETTNKKNEVIHIKSKKYLVLIVFGFLLQVCANAISLFN